jgi:hypothetical protein
MEMTYVGIDVSKDRLDVHVLPERETFVVAPDGKGLTEFVERMGTLGPERIPVEATAAPRPSWRPRRRSFTAGRGGQSGASASLRQGARAPRRRATVRGNSSLAIQ